MWKLYAWQNLTSRFATGLSAAQAHELSLILRIGKTGRSLLIVALSVVAVSAPAFAQTPFLHFPMEATEENGGKVYVNNDGSATIVPGKIGNALLFSGEATFARPFTFDRRQYPQVTITAWVKQPAGREWWAYHLQLRQQSGLCPSQWRWYDFHECGWPRCGPLWR